MAKVVYRERAEFTYEHVALVDGIAHKVENNTLFIREPDAIVGKDENGNAITEPVWAECEGPWEVIIDGRTPGVYPITEAA